MLNADSSKLSGKLYIVPTPIGNLGDITLRALEILKSSDIILAEDTRKSSILLKHYEIKVKTWAHHKFNEHKALSSVVAELKSGKIISLISDAGTPGISDPGFLLIRSCHEEEIEVETLPGAKGNIQNTRRKYQGNHSVPH